MAFPQANPANVSWATSSGEERNNPLSDPFSGKEPMTDDEKLKCVLEVLQVKDISQSIELLKTQAEVKKHLLHLYEVLELYKSNGFFAEMSAASERTNKRQAQHALDLFHMMNNQKQQSVVHKNKKKRHRLFYASAIFFFLLHTAGLTLSILSSANIDVGIPGDNPTASPVGMGYINAIGGLVQAFVELKMGNYAMAAGLALSNSQLLVCTIVAHAAANAGLISSFLAGGLMAGSIALMMTAAGAWEFNEVRKSKRRIKLLKSQLSNLAKTDANKEKHEDLEHALVIERARRDNHIRHGKSWLYCSAAMIATSAIVFASLGALSFGALPAVTAAIGMVAILCSVIRKYTVNKVNHLEQAHLAKERGVVTNLMNLELDEITLTNGAGKSVKIDLSKQITVPGMLGLFSSKMTIKEYLTEMLHKDADKADKLVNALKHANYHQLKEHLSEHKLWKDGAKFAKELLKHIEHSDDSPSFGSSESSLYPSLVEFSNA